MAKKYHLTNDNEVKVCKAELQECKYGGVNPHFSNKAEALAAAEEINAKEFGNTIKIKKDSTWQDRYFEVGQNGRFITGEDPYEWTKEGTNNIVNAFSEFNPNLDASKILNALDKAQGVFKDKPAAKMIFLTSVRYNVVELARKEFSDGLDYIANESPNKKEDIELFQKVFNEVQVNLGDMSIKVDNAEIADIIENRKEKKRRNIKEIFQMVQLIN